MKTQVVCIFLSALLCSTFAHDFLRARELSSHLKHHGYAKHHLSQSRAGSDDNCSIVCDAPSVIIGDLELHINGSIAAFLNASANVALLLDLEASITVLLDGNSGGALVINIESQTGVYIAAGIWVAAKIEFAAYLATLTSLSVLLKIAGAVQVTVAAASDAVLKFALGVVSKLVGSIELQVKDALKLILALSASLIASLKVVVKLAEAGAIKVAGCLIVLANKLAGIAKLVKGGIKVSLKLLLSGISGVAVLTAIILAAKAQVLEHSLNVTLSSVEEVVVIIHLLGGAVVSASIDGIFTVLASIVHLKNNSISINEFFNIVITVAGGIHASIDIEGELQILADAAAGLSVVVALVKGVLDGSLQIAGVATKKIIASLTVAVSNVLAVVVVIVVAIKAIVSVTSSIVALFTHLVGLLLSVKGKLLLLEIGLIKSVSVSIVDEIKAALNPITILQILSGGITAVISKVGTLGVIFNALVEASASAGVDFKAALSSSSQVVGIIKGLIAYASSALATVLGIAGNVSELAKSSQGLVELSGGVSVSVEVSANVSLSVN